MLNHRSHPAHQVLASASGARTAAVRQTGSAYVVVLATSALIVLIGITSVSMARIGIQRIQLHNDALEARLLAASAVEHATVVIGSNATSIASMEALSYGQTISNLGSGSAAWTLTRDPVVAFTDTVLLRGTLVSTAAVREATFRLSVNLSVDRSGRVTLGAGSWRRVVD